MKFVAKSTSYGCKHEKIAIDKYKSVAMQTHKRLKVTSAGLILKNQKSYFGASPDSLLQCMCCGNGVLEVKCPYRAQTKGFEEVAESNKQFCLVKDSEDSNYDPRAYGGGFLGFQETPFDSKTISKIICLNNYRIINILASYAYLSANTIYYLSETFM